MNITQPKQGLELPFRALLTCSVCGATSAGECFLPRCKGMVLDAVWGATVPSTSPKGAFQLWQFTPRPGEDQMALWLLANPCPVSPS